MNKKFNTVKINFFRGWILPVLCAFILAFLIKKFILFKVAVPTGSMLPTVQLNDQLFVTKVYKPSQLKRGDIVVFEKAGEEHYLLKRIIGLPNDNIDIKDNGDVYINGEKLSEPYVKYKEAKGGTYKVPDGHYFMLGDNRAKSADARTWPNPYISFKNIKGKTWFRAYPFNSFGSIE